MARVTTCRTRPSIITLLPVLTLPVPREAMTAPDLRECESCEQKSWELIEETYVWMRIDKMSQLTKIQVYHLGAIRENLEP